MRQVNARTAEVMLLAERGGSKAASPDSHPQQAILFFPCDTSGFREVSVHLGHPTPGHAVVQAGIPLSALAWATLAM